MIDALPEADRALWATAFYTGLRCGELRALAWEQIDFDQNLIHVERAWDRVAGVIDPKSRAGRRSVPLSPTLRGILLEHRLRTGGREGLAFGGAPDRAFDPTSATRRAHKVWAAAGLPCVTLHDAGTTTRRF